MKMKLIRIGAILCCAVLCMAGTRGTIVTQAQIDRFRKGTTTLSDVEGELGMPQNTHPLDDGDSAVDYILIVQEGIEDCCSPIGHLKAERHDLQVEFEFDTASHLVGETTSRRDMICDHNNCPTDTTPWRPGTAPSSPAY
jgi:hypothetical protein